MAHWSGDGLDLALPWVDPASPSLDPPPTTYLGKRAREDGGSPGEDGGVGTRRRRRPSAPLAQVAEEERHGRAEDDGHER